eukprot:SAG22_NODE_1460_length_4373_cov_4.000702_4_plen_85_part_01
MYTPVLRLLLGLLWEWLRASKQSGCSARQATLGGLVRSDTLDRAPNARSGRALNLSVELAKRIYAYGTREQLEWAINYLEANYQP